MRRSTQMHSLLVSTHAGAQLCVCNVSIHSFCPCLALFLQVSDKENVTAIFERAMSMPRCIKGMQGPCWEGPMAMHRGIAIYRAGEKVCLSDILLPGFNLLPSPLLGFIYLIFLCYLFAGVSIAADLFMDGIMQITSIMKTVKRRNQHGDIVEVQEPVWNWVVANISLMALGTSAPEIMLSLVEALLTLDQPAGELGPACIVGSAAYNLLMISAVCTIAMADGQFKRIEQLRVYVTTCIWSLWAYIWMLVVYRWWTPDEVTIVEAFLTLAFFGMLVLNAWLVDTQPWKKRVYMSPPPASSADSSEGKELATLDLEAAQRSACSPEEKQAAKNAAFFRSVIEQRHRAGRGRLSSKGEHNDEHKHVVAVCIKSTTDRQQVMFRSSVYSFLESAGMVKVAVVRIPPAGSKLDSPLNVHWCTEDGDAIAGLDYEAASGTLVFEDGESSKYINIKIIDDSVSEPDVTFSILLTSAEACAGRPEPLIIQPRVAVTIVDDDDAGLLGFELPQYEVGYNAKHLWAEVTVVRRRGADGRVTVDYETADDSATAGHDYEHSSGHVVFESGQKSSKVRIPLLASGLPEAHKAFKVVLKNPDGGAELSSRATTRVTIVQRALTMYTPMGVKLMDDDDLTLAKADGGSDGSNGGGSENGSGGGEFNVWSAWKEQILDSFNMQPPDEGASWGWGSYVMHYVNFSWRLILVCMVPPAEWKGGYPCFGAALCAVIGIVYLVNEAGVLFGCVVGLKDLMTGISIVAMGTSLPDTLASRISAIKDPDADAAIGNITGSNSVNVFLGLGLPWVICSVYYKAKGVKYDTPAGDLSFSIMLFAIVGGLGIGILALARRYGGELGGSKKRQYCIAAVLTVLWLLYLILSGLRAYGHLPGEF